MTWTEPENDPSTAPPSTNDPDFGTLRYVSLGNEEDAIGYVEEDGSFPLKLQNQDGSGVSTLPEVLISDASSQFSPAAPGVGSGVGDMFGPGAATDHALVRWDTTDGQTTQNSVAILSDAGVLTNLTGLTLAGNITINGPGVIYMKERAAPDSDIGSYGQWWTKTVTPNQPWFTDDASTDWAFLLAKSGVIANNAIPRGDGGIYGLQDSNVIISDIWDVSGINDLAVDGQITVGNGDFIGNVSEDERIVFRSTGGGFINFYTANTLHLAIRNDGDINIPIGNLIMDGGTFYMKERAAADTDFAGYGQVWSKTATPSELWFTDDASSDFRLGHPDPVIVESLLDFFNGTIIEDFDATVASDGATITLSLEKSGGGDLLMNFSDGQTILDTDPTPATITITAGTDISPVSRYVYILQSGKVLVEAASWPSTEHIRIAYLLVPSATRVNTLGGTYINQNWNDHAMGSDTSQGHMQDLGIRHRRSGAIWVSGCLGTATVDVAETPDAIWVDVAAGVVSQMHDQDFSALDSDPAGAADSLAIINHNTVPYTAITGLQDITEDSTGASIGTNKYFSVVLWAAMNKGGEPTLMLINVPSGIYGSLNGAQADSFHFTDFSIPVEYGLESSTGFLIAEFIIKKGPTNYTLEDTIDLRGKTPGTAAGSAGSVGDVTAAIILTDNALVRGDGGAKGIQDSGVLLNDTDDLSAINDLDMTGDLSVGGDITIEAGDLIIQDNPTPNIDFRSLDTTIAINGNIGTLDFRTNDSDIGTNVRVALMQARSEQSFTSGNAATAFVFYTSNTGDGSVNEVIRFKGSGLIDIAGDTDIGGDLNVTGEMEGSPLLLECGQANVFVLTNGGTDERYMGVAIGTEMTANRGFLMEKPGSFVGYSIMYDTTAESGTGQTVSFVVEKNGATIYTDVMGGAATVGDNKKSFASQARDTSGDTFAANDVLSVKLRISGGGASVTIDDVMATIRIYYDE